MRCVCHIPPCEDRTFETIEDLAYHAQEKHGTGYYRRPKPGGYDERYPDESKQVATGRG